MYAKDASFGDDLAQAYGIEWERTCSYPDDEDSRYTTNVEAFLGAQQEWMTQHLPKKGVIAETNDYGQVKLPPKAERVYGKPGEVGPPRSTSTATARCRRSTTACPRPRRRARESRRGGCRRVVSKPRPDVTRKGIEMIGDLRTDALHEALARAPIEDDTLMALLVLAFAGQNVSVDSAGGRLPLRQPDRPSCVNALR
jgi:hypothetical protein